jgi:hypothetical protein
MPVTLADPDAAPLTARPEGPRFSLVVGALLLLVLAAAGAVFLLTRPRLIFTNSLAAPVTLSIGQGAPRTVASGATVRVMVSRGRTLVAEWRLSRPRSADDQPMGVELHGAMVLRSPRGTMRMRAGSRSGDGDYFAPLITNATSRLLRVAVNAGLSGAMDCGCAVRPGATRVFIGYYHLFQNSTVEVRAGELRASFRDLGARVTAANGTVGLRFEDQDLRRP